MGAERTPWQQAEKAGWSGCPHLMSQQRALLLLPHGLVRFKVGQLHAQVVAHDAVIAGCNLH